MPSPLATLITGAGGRGQGWRIVFLGLIFTNKTEKGSELREHCAVSFFLFLLGFFLFWLYWIRGYCLIGWDRMGIGGFDEIASSRVRSHPLFYYLAQPCEKLGTFFAFCDTGAWAKGFGKAFFLVPGLFILQIPEGLSAAKKTNSLPQKVSGVKSPTPHRSNKTKHHGKSLRAAWSKIDGPNARGPISSSIPAGM